MASFVETQGHAVDEKHFEALYETYRTDVQRLASYLLKNAADAEDAAQTVFLNVLRALRQGVKPADPRAWLLAITRNVCFSRHRAAAARPVLVELEPDEAAAGQNGDETPSADEIVGALARLLPNQRTALILRDFRGVSRAEISDLMELSPVAVEALLTRARTAFREELEAGEQPFACAETKKLVEDQLDGLITVADRHSLRSHLRHCGECSTLARAVRSSRGKLASLILWPVDLVSRLVAALSQAPTAAHVATALTSTAAVATIAIPAAISTSPQLAHQARVAPWPVAAAAPAITRSATATVSASVVVRQTQPLASAPTVAWHPVAQKAPVHTRAHTRPATRHAAHRPPAHVSATPRARSAPATTRPSTGSGGSVHTFASPGTEHPSTPTTSPSTAGPRSPSGFTTPRAAAPPRSVSPASKPSTKPKSKPKPRSKPRSKPSRKSGKHGGKGRHEPQPPSQMPTSQPPVASTAPSGDGAATAGSGNAIGTESTSSAAAPSSSSSASSSSSSSSGSSGSSGNGQNAKDKKNNGNGNGSGNGNGKGKNH